MYTECIFGIILYFSLNHLNACEKVGADNNPLILKSCGIPSPVYNSPDWSYANMVDIYSNPTFFNYNAIS